MVEIRVGAEAEETVHATVIATSPTRIGWRVLTAEEIAAGCTGNPNDPYDSIGERAEGCFVGQLVNRLLKLVGLADPDGFCSTYREWHIFLRGFHSGFNTALGAKFEPVPEMWEDEAQYYESAQEIGYIVKNGKLYIPLTILGTLIVDNYPFIMASLPLVLNYLKSMVGM